MEEFTFYFFGRAPRGNRIAGRKVRVHNKPGNRTIAFSADCIKEIAAIPNPKMGFSKSNITGELYIVINSEQGVEVKSSNSNRKSPSPMVYSKEIVDFLVKELHLTEVTTDVAISEIVVNRPDMITYKILAK